MAKIIVNGETFDYDSQKQLTHEALWIEDLYKRNYLQWQEDMTAGSTRALCMLACLLWRRDGRDVDTAFQDMLDGKIEFDVNETWVSIIEAGQAAQREAEAQDPTIPGVPPDPDGSPTTGTGTSGSSPSGSGSARGKSGSSKSRTSRP